MPAVDDFPMEEGVENVGDRMYQDQSIVHAGLVFPPTPPLPRSALVAISLCLSFDCVLFSSLPSTHYFPNDRFSAINRSNAYTPKA